MGLCFSSGGGGAAAEGSRAAAPKATAMVLLPTGEMREYPAPATAARVLEDCCCSSSDAAGDKGKGAGWFLCDADRMGFEGPVAAVGAAEALRAGQIYFVLPAECRRRGLRREEVAALAVKASAALSRTAAATAAAGPGRRRRGAVAPLVFAPPEEEDEEDRAAAEAHAAIKAAAAPPKRRPVARHASGRRMQRFASDLTAIPEGDMNGSE